MGDTSASLLSTFVANSTTLFFKFCLSHLFLSVDFRSEASLKLCGFLLPTSYDLCPRLLLATYVHSEHCSCTASLRVYSPTYIWHNLQGSSMYTFAVSRIWTTCLLSSFGFFLQNSINFCPLSFLDPKPNCDYDEKMLHRWKDNSMLVKRFASCTYLPSIVSELCDA